MREPTSGGKARWAPLRTTPLPPQHPRERGPEATGNRPALWRILPHVSGDTTPCVKSLRPSYTGLYLWGYNPVGRTFRQSWRVPVGVSCCGARATVGDILQVVDDILESGSIPSLLGNGKPLSGFPAGEVSGPLPVPSSAFRETGLTVKVL